MIASAVAAVAVIVAAHNANAHGSSHPPEQTRRVASTCFWQVPGYLKTVNLAAATTIVVSGNDLTVWFGRDATSIKTSTPEATFNLMQERIAQCEKGE